MSTTKIKLEIILTSQVLLVCFFSLEVMGSTEGANVAGDWMGARISKTKLSENLAEYRRALDP